MLEAPRVASASCSQEAVVDSPITITLKAPGKNALGTPQLDALRQALRDAGGRPLLLTGSGDAFSAGLDIREVAALTDFDEMCAFLRNLDAATAELFDYAGPTVALVNGHAIAGGCVLVQCCDFRIANADPRLKIGLNEVGLGVAFPPVIMATMLARIPRRHHHEVLLAAELHGADEGLRLGLLDVVAEDAAAAAEQRLAGLARTTPEAYAAAKREIRGGVTSIDEATSRGFYENEAKLWVSPEVKALLRAALGG